MENSPFQRPSHLNFSVKQMLIENFLHQESQKPDSVLASLKLNTIKKELPTTGLNSSQIISQSSINKLLDSSRPSSACSSKSTNLYNTQHQDSNISSEFLLAINKITLKVIKECQKGIPNENIELLVFSFLIILKNSDKALNKNYGLKLIRTNSFEIFKKLLTVPGNFVKQIRALPATIRVKRVPEKDLKKSLAWLNMVNYETLSVFKPIHDLLVQLFLYSKKYYSFPITFTTFFDKSKKNKNKINFSYTKTEENSEFKLLNNKALTTSIKNYHPILEINNENDLQIENSLKQSKKKPDLSLNTTTRKQKTKNEIFFQNSRIIQKIHEKFLSFLKNKKQNEEFVEENFREKIKNAINEFSNTLNENLVLKAVKYLENFTSTKEFLLILNKL